MTFRRCLEPFERTRFLTLESQWKKLNSLILLLLTIKSKTRLKSCNLGLNCVSDLAYLGKVRYIASCNIFAINNNLLEDFLFCHGNNQL